MNSKRSSSKKPPPPNPNLNPTQSLSKLKKHKKKKSKPHHQENPNPNPSPPPPPPKKTSSAAAMDTPPPVMASPASKKRKSRDPDDGDSLTILEAVIDFQSENRGANPTPTNMGPLFESVRDTLHADYTLDQLYNRIRHLRQKYYRQLENGNVGPTPHDRAFYELSARAWGDTKKRAAAAAAPGPTSNGAPTKPKPKAEAKPKPEMEKVTAEEDDGLVGDEEMEDAEIGGEGGGDSFKYLNHQAREYWQAMGLTAESLEMGLKSMDRAKAKLLEKKWAQHGDAGLKIQAKQSEIERDLFLALHAARKGTN